MAQRPEMEAVFAAVARYFALLSDPMRLNIMHAVCSAELSVGEIVERTGGSQTNVSRHLNLMYERGALARRKQGSLVYYRIADTALIEMCRGVCARVTEELDRDKPLRRGLKRVMDGLAPPESASARRRPTPRTDPRTSPRQIPPT